MIWQEKLVSWPVITDEDKRAVLSVLNEGRLTGNDAPALQNLEQAWARYVGVKYCLGFNGGTAAIHAALFAVGVTPGDEVVMPALSFSGTFLPVTALGAVPVFVDVQPHTFNMDPDQIEAKITKRTRVVMPVHLHGLPADMDRIRDIADRHGLIVVEDAAQAHGAEFMENKVGSLGRVGCFSLNHTKNLPAGEGGLLTTDDFDVYTRAAAFRVFGEYLPTPGYRFRPYLTRHEGYNYILPAMSAALARSQLGRLDDHNAVACRNASLLDDCLAGLDGLVHPVVPPGRTHTYHKYRVRLNKGSLTQAMDFLLEEGVPVTRWQIKPMPHYPFFKGWSCYNEDYPESQRLLNGSFILGDERRPLMCQPLEVIEGYCQVLRRMIDDIGNDG